MDITHTSRGLLIPRLPLVDVNDVTTIAAPALSLLIFNTATAGIAPNDVKPGFYYFNGTKWVGIGTGNAWELLGNTGTNAATNFIGTTDAQDLVFKTNGIENVRVLNTNGNVGIGTNAPIARTHIYEPTGFAGTVNPLRIGLNVEIPPQSSNGYYIFKGSGGSLLNAGIVYGLGLDLNPTATTTGTRYGVYIENETQNYFSNNVGINTTTPANKLEITHGTAGNSGLRFTNLPNATALSTNATGDVIPTTLNPANALYWGLTGNSGTTPATNFVGTTDAQDLVFKTNSLEHMRIANASWNVGIGTNTPLSRLHVAGGGNIGAGIEMLSPVTSFSASTALSLVNTDPTANNMVNIYFGDQAIGNANAIIGARYTSHVAGSKSTDFEFYTTDVGTIKMPMIIKSNGNVGVGTTSPAAKLQVMDNANRRTLHVEHDFTGLSNTDAAFIGGIDAGYTSTGLFVLQKDAIGFGSSGTNLLNVVKNSVSQMVVNGLGYVGIGMPTPSVTLDVQANTNVQASAIARFNRTGTASIGWLAIHSGALAGDWSGLTSAGDKSIIFTNDNNPALDDPSGLVIAPWTGAGNPNQAKGIKIMESGNVGVGTGAPAAILDVTSTTAGFAMPRMTSAQRKAIVAPIAGLDVYDLTLKGHYTFDGTKWDCSDNPAGSVNYFANATVPNGYLECNGQSVSTTTYAELFAAIGYLYGGAGASFNVPDLRGEFIRGVDNARGADAGRSIGTWQVASAFLGDGDAVNLPHPNLNDATQKTVLGWENDVAPANSTGITVAFSPSAAGSCVISGVHSNGTASTCIEFARTRPRNVAMLPCIKF
jgi:microcystin-dependent protein